MDDLWGSGRPHPAIADLGETGRGAIVRRESLSISLSTRPPFDIWMLHRLSACGRELGT